MKTQLVAFSLLFIWSANLAGQERGLDTIHYQRDDLHDMTGFALGYQDEYLLVLGGCTQGGLEQEERAIPNTDLIVLDTKRGEAVAMTTGWMPASIAAQLAAFGMSYYQEQERLYILGGYGYSAEHNCFTTFPAMLILNVPLTIQAVLAGQNPSPFIQQVYDPRLAVANAYLEKSDELFLLAEGHHAYMVNPDKDDAIYFVKNYDDQVRTFRMETIDGQFQIVDFNIWTDLNAFFDHFENIIPSTIFGTGEYRFKSELYY